MTETIELTHDELKTILKLFFDGTELLEEIPSLQDQGRFSEASQHIGAELEARVTEMNQLENNNEKLREIIKEIQGGEQSTELTELERKVLD